MAISSGGGGGRAALHGYIGADLLGVAGVGGGIDLEELDCLILDACALDDLLSRKARGFVPRIIVPAQAFVREAGNHRRVQFEASGWNESIEVQDIAGVEELHLYRVLQRNLSACQAAGLILTRRYNGTYVAPSADVLAKHARAVLGEVRIVPANLLWSMLASDSKEVRIQ